MATATTRRSPKLTLEMAHEQLVAGVEAITTSDQWLAYLAVAAKFTRYSANNTFLIMMQRPDATRVAGFHTWKSLGRSVKKGSKGIAILCPACDGRRSRMRPAARRAPALGWPGSGSVTCSTWPIPRERIFPTMV